MTKRTGRPVGRPPAVSERNAWVNRFVLSKKQGKDMSDKLMEQLSLCRSDEARRLILGVKP